MQSEFQPPPPLQSFLAIAGGLVVGGLAIAALERVAQQLPNTPPELDPLHPASPAHVP